MSTESHTIPPKHVNSNNRRYLPYGIAFLLIQILGAFLLITAYNRYYMRLAIGSTVANILLVYFLYYANKQTSIRAAQVETLVQTNEQLANEIEQRIETETRLDEARLLAEKAQETAETANVAKSAFLASMNHELRTPLNGILGYTQLLLLDSSLNNEQKHDLEIIQHSGEHLLVLLNDILDLSKIESGTMSLSIDCIDLPSFVRTISEIVAVNAADKGLQCVSQDKTAVSHAICVDNIRLRQVLVNLLGNAIKFTQVGHVTLTVLNITPDDHPPERRLLRFEVEDSGIGISETNIEKMFAPFEQLGTHLYPKAGTGLGLSISSKLLAMMGTTLQVESTLGKGSRFWFDLDVAIEERETAVLPTAPTSPPSTRGIDGKKPLILVVDDHPGNRRLLFELLTPFGFTVVTNDSGQAALETVAKERPHLILMDLVMPAMDGYETVRRIREQSADNQDKRCPIIAISANAFTEERNQSLEAGYDDFIAKPFKAELLLAMIEKHLGSSWGWLREDRDDADTKQNPGSPVPPPSASITTALLDFAKIGDVRGLKKQVDILLDEEKIAPETAAMFNKLIRNYQLSELTTLLQSYLV